MPGTVSRIERQDRARGNSFVQDRKWQITLRSIMVGIAVIAATLAVVAAAQRDGPVGYFFWLASQSIEVGLVLLPIPALFAVTGLIVAAIAAIRNPAPLKGKWVWLLLPFVVPTGILAYGVAFNYSGPLGSAAPWRGQVLEVLVWVHVPIGVVLLVVARKNPLVPIGLSVFQWWASCSAAIMSYMSVTNIWL
jgi:hypothetical protein